MSQKKDSAKERYLWARSGSLRDKHQLAWWAGYRAKKGGQSDVVPSNNWTDEEQRAFHAGYEYRKEMYGD